MCVCVRCVCEGCSGGNADITREVAAQVAMPGALDIKCTKHYRPLNWIIKNKRTSNNHGTNSRYIRVENK